MKFGILIFLACGVLSCGQYIRADQSSGDVIEWGMRRGLTGQLMPATNVLDDVIAVSPEVVRCLALKSDGTVYQWSWDRDGYVTFNNIQLGSGETSVVDKGGSHITYTNETRTITNGIVTLNGKMLNGIVSIAAGREGFSMGLKRDGTLTAWGEGSVPYGLTNIKAIAVAGIFNLAVKADGSVVEWGNWGDIAKYGQLMEVPVKSNVVSVAMGETAQGVRVVALKSDGTVAHWGTESIYKEATPPPGLGEVVSLAVGQNHTLALKSDGTIIGWGRDDVGQATGVPTKDPPFVTAGPVMLGGQVLSNVVSVAANKNYSLALKRDGTVVAWGRMSNDEYPATVPEGLNGVVAIAAGPDYCLAITTNKIVAQRFQRK